MDTEQDDQKPDFKLKVIQEDWVNRPSVADLKKDFDDAKPDHATATSKIAKWLDNLNVTGAAVVKSEVGRSNLVPKLIRKHAEWRYSSIIEPFLSTDDVFNVEPITFEDKDAAEQNGLILNNQFNTKIDKVKFFDEYVRTAVDEGTAIVRVSWDFKEEQVDVEVPTYTFVSDASMLEMHKQIAVLAENSPEDFVKDVTPELQQAHRMYRESGGVPYRPQQNGTKIVQQTQTVKNEPVLDVCHYANVLIDPTCMGDLDKANFVIYSFETSKSQLQSEGKYHNLDFLNKSASDILAHADHEVGEGVSFNFDDTARKKVVAYEYWGYWDINNDGVMVPIVATYVDSVMIRLEENPFPDKRPPFVSVQYLPVRRSIYGEPDGALLEENQKVVGAVMRGMIDLMGRSANSQIGIRKDALDMANRAKFKKGMDYEFNPGVDATQVTHMHKYPEIPKSTEVILGMMHADADSLTGIKAFNDGISGQALGRTATGVKSALDATSKREMGILHRIAKGVKQISRKIISMNAVFLEEEEIVRITNSEFVTVRRDDLAGKTDIRLNISTPEADDHKAKELAFMLQTMGNNMDPSISKMILVDIANLHKMPTLAQKIKEYEPQPDPLQVRKAELEVQLLEAQIAESQSRTQENLAEANLDQAKAGTEGAKTADLNAKVDQSTLNFVEQESGTKHARDVDKIEAQSDGNMKLSAVNHILDRDKESAAKATP